MRGIIIYVCTITNISRPMFTPLRIYLSHYENRIIQLSVCLLCILLLLRFITVRRSGKPPGHAVYFYSTFTMPYNEFYSLVERKLQDHNIPHLEFKGVRFFPEGTGIRTSRAYFVIRRKNIESIFCAAPFGTDYFFSMWTIERCSVLRVVVRAIPFFGERLENAWFGTTFYKVDTVSVYHSIVQHVFIEAMNECTDGKATRLNLSTDSKPHLADVFAR